jgi:kynurenine formamidase
MASRWVDLTMPIVEGMPRNLAHGRSPVFLSGTQTHRETARRDVRNVYEHDDVVSTENDVVLLSTHNGTHLDAPFHADASSSLTIDRLPLDVAIGTAVCLDVSSRSGPRAAVGEKDLERAEALLDAPVARGEIVLVRTDWDDRMAGDPVAWYEEHPGLSRDGAEWLRARGARLVGIDSCSVDPAGAADLPAHMNFLRPASAGLDAADHIAVIESLVGLAQLPAHRFEFFAAPLPFAGATGSPIRALARLA